MKQGDYAMDSDIHYVISSTWRKFSHSQLEFGSRRAGLG